MRALHGVDGERKKEVLVCFLQDAERGQRFPVGLEEGAYVADDDSEDGELAFLKRGVAWRGVHGQLGGLAGQLRQHGVSAGCRRRGAAQHAVRVSAADTYIQ